MSETPFYYTSTIEAGDHGPDRDEFMEVCRRLQDERGNGFSANAVALAMGLSRRLVVKTLTDLEQKGLVNRISARLWQVTGTRQKTDQRGRYRNRLPLITTVAPDTMATIDRVMHRLHLPSYGSVIDMMVAVSSHKFLENDR